MDKLTSEAMVRIEDVDDLLREQHTGKPLIEIVGPAGAAFAHVGVNLVPTEIRAYAQSVSDDEPFEVAAAPTSGV